MRDTELYKGIILDTNNNFTFPQPFLYNLGDAGPGGGGVGQQTGVFRVELVSRLPVQLEAATA